MRASAPARPTEDRKSGERIKLSTPAEDEQRNLQASNKITESLVRRNRRHDWASDPNDKR
ncbi:hypothetical protein GCM10010198_26600 [Nocardia seriolae]|nr:hypothetical protein NSERKGN1266_05080 [Nocardia seriolae]BEK92512.1 hypothetical protein NSER024013_04180 [Nocardia seriolae]GEM26325.1 hypothetical protein NS2_45640 [Nocardia seriolae NBRC 15557]